VLEFDTPLRVEQHGTVVAENQMRVGELMVLLGAKLLWDGLAG